MLVKTYDNCLNLFNTSDSIETPALLMVGQAVLNADIEIILDSKAEIITARFLDKKTDKIETRIPCTEESGLRTGDIAPHPLHDKLQFLAKDYEKFGGKKPGWNEYIKQLNSWCSSEFSHSRVLIVRDFLEKGHLIEQLLEKNILPTDDNGKNKTLNYFVRFDVQSSLTPQKKLWEDDSVQAAFMAWQNSLESFEGGSKNICYVTGKNSLIADKHPKGIIRGNYGAKLISGNDKTNFVFRGRFHEKEDAVAISYEASQKAHNMLKWLTENHGFQNGSQIFVAWGTKLQEIPDMYKDSYDLFGLEENEPSEPQNSVALRTEYVKRLSNAMRGYGKNIQDSDDIMVLGLNASTPGRASIIFYRELKGSDFLKRIENWHTYCSWMHNYKSIDGIDEKNISFFGAPAPLDMIKAAYGESISDNQKKANIEMLVHCIIDGRPIPKGFRNSLVQRASRPTSMKYSAWQKTLSIACSVICRHLNYEKNKGGYIWQMAVDEQNKDRSYLFGRLLAYAEHIERYTYYKANTPARQTNAERMMHSFALKPAKTWQLLFLRLQSYLKHVDPVKLNWWKKEVNSIIDSLGQQGFNNKALEEQFLLGYSSQMMSFYRKKDNDEKDSNTFEEEK